MSLLLNTIRASQTYPRVAGRKSAGDHRVSRNSITPSRKAHRRGRFVLQNIFDLLQNRRRKLRDNLQGLQILQDLFGPRRAEDDRARVGIDCDPRKGKLRDSAAELYEREATGTAVNTAKVVFDQTDGRPPEVEGRWTERTHPSQRRQTVSSPSRSSSDPPPRSSC